MTTIWVISEECHGNICYATSFKAAKQYLIRADWVCGNSPADDTIIDSPSLIELYGENWEEQFLQFDPEKLENMGYYVNQEDVVEEK